MMAMTAALSAPPPHAKPFDVRLIWIKAQTAKPFAAPDFRGRETRKRQYDVAIAQRAVFFSPRLPRTSCLHRG
jgi:hypothetical protein